MAMRDWIHKYPGVQALLQQDAEDELLGACVEADTETPEVLATQRARYQAWQRLLAEREGLAMTALRDEAPVDACRHLSILVAFREARTHAEMATGRRP